MAFLFKGSEFVVFDADRESIRNSKIVEIVFGKPEKSVSVTGALTPAAAAASLPKVSGSTDKKGASEAEILLPKVHVNAERKKALEIIPVRTHPNAFVPIWGKKPRRKQSPIMEHLNMTSPTRRRRRPAHFLPMLKEGKLVVPQAAISGFHLIDEKNVLLSKIYTRISELLQNKQISILNAEFTGCEDNVLDRVVQQEVSALRTEGFKIRRSVKSLYGAPLAEPLTYWRWKYNLVSF